VAFRPLTLTKHANAKKKFVEALRSNHICTVSGYLQYRTAETLCTVMAKSK